MHERWAGLKQAFRLTRERTIRGQKSVEVVYGITSLSKERADAAKLLRLSRDHWRIENSLHYVRDVTLAEDACRVRCGTAPQILASMRNVAVHLLSSLAKPSHAAAIRHLNIHLHRAIQLITNPGPE